MHVVVHNAVSVDGRIDGFAPDVGRYYELAGSWVGGGTSARSFVRGPDPDDGATDLDPLGVESFDDGAAWLRYES